MINEKDLNYFEKNKKILYNLIIHVKEHIPFYKELYKFEIPDYDSFDYNFWNSIPYLEKRYVRDDSKKFIDIRENIDELTIETTSGTEGKPIICYKNKIEIMECSNTLWSLRRRFVKDLRPTDRFARFYAFRNKNDSMIYNKILYKNSDILLPMFDLSTNRLIEYWKAIVEFKPRWIHGPSSTIYNLAIVVKEHNLTNFKFELIELSGEYVSKEQMDFIGDVLGINITNQYGCREYWPMAYTSKCGGLEVTNNVFMETLDIDTNEKEIVITTLKNNTWPLIKYKLGDIGEINYLDNKPCVFLRQGRKADIFTLNGNKLFNAVLFSGIARGVCELYNENVILQFQIIKLTEDEIKVKVKLSESKNRYIILDYFKNEIKKIIGDNVLINFEIVDYILPDSKTGKTKDFIDLSSKVKQKVYI